MGHKRGVGQMLTKADEGGGREGGVRQMLTIADKGGGGVQEPLILAGVICEQPLILNLCYSPALQIHRWYWLDMKIQEQLILLDTVTNPFLAFQPPCVPLK